jgi:hypothetical protein
MDANGNPDTDAFTPDGGFSAVTVASLDSGVADSGFAESLKAAAPYGGGYTPVRLWP